HHRRGRLKGDALRQLDETVRLDQPLSRVSAEARGIGDPVAQLETRHALPDSGDFAGTLVAGREGKRRHWISPAAKIGVDEIDADRMVADKHLTARWRRRRNVFDPHHLGPANLVNPDSFCHGPENLRLDPSAAIRLAKYHAANSPCWQDSRAQVPSRFGSRLQETTLSIC